MSLTPPERDALVVEPPGHEHRVGRVITFYSYKGGTGRTMALANCAWVLAANGYRVLAVDWDLEAPGLNRFFAPFLEQSALDASTGVIDLIHDYREEMLEQQAEFDQERLRSAARVLPHVLSLNWSGFPGEGCLHFLPAGQAHSDYGATVAGINWDEFYAAQHGAEFFRELRKDMQRQYDYVLIDSRTGLSDIQEICTVELPDDLVICFTLSNQSIEGASDIARKITERYYNRGIRILPVPMRIDDGEKSKADAGRALARKRFAGLPQNLSEAARDHHWSSVEIPYQPYYAYEEILAPFGDKPGSPISMLSAVERLVTSVTEGRVTALPPMDEDMRLHFADLFTRPRPTAREDIILSYASEDRMWAEWIEWVLTRAGLQVMLRELGSLVRHESNPSRDAVTRTVAVWSQAYDKAVQSRLARELLVGERSEDQQDVINIRVGEVRSVSSFGSNSVELLRLEEDAARAVLLRAVGLPETALMDVVPGEGPRFPGRRPAIWNLRLRNPAFTGRAAVLDRLRDQLRGQQRDRRSTVVLPTPQTLYGLGGVGKTQVALEYAHRFMADYDLVWWIESEQPEQVAVSLTELGRRLDLRVGENANENAELVKETLRLGAHSKARRWLLIFDNADDPAQIVRFFPGGSGDVLVTSRNQAWSSHAEALEVDVFRREESIEHLCRRSPTLSQAEAAMVAEAVGDLPLAVEIASAWLETTGVTVADYVDQLHGEAVKALAVTKPVDYPNSFGATYNVSIARLREQMPAAVRLLQLCAFLAPDSIAMSIFYSDQMMNALIPFDDELRDKNMMGRVIRAIGRYGLAKVDNSNRTFQVHRMIQAVIRAELTAEEEDDLIHEVHRVLVGARPDFGDTDDPENWPLFELIWPHLEPSKAENCDEADTRQLLIDRVRYRWKRGDLDRAEELGRFLDDTWTQKLGEDDRQTLQLRFQLASVLRSMGRVQECLELDEDTLARQARVLRPDHPLTLQTAGNLAADLRALGRFPEALKRDQETYLKMKEELGEEDPRTLNIANNLAIDRRFNGEYEAARILDEEVFRLRTEVLGAAHPYTLTSKANLAEDERALGNYTRSISLLSEFREEYTVPVPDLASLRYTKSLAVSLRRAGQQTEARRLTLDTYNRYLERYSAEVPDALSCALNLAAEYSAAGDKELARETAQGVYRYYRDQLGPTHPFTLICANNLTIYLRDIGQPAQRVEAVTMGERTLEDLAETLGEDHPYTLCATLNLANSYGDTGDLARAEELGRRALEGLSVRYGAKHPDALICQSNLAITLRDRSQEAEATDLRNRAIDQLILHLGENHPTVYNARAWRRMGRDLELVPA